MATIHTGQRYRFVQAAAPDTHQVLTVTSVSASEVRYTVRTLAGGGEDKPLRELRFPRDPAAVLPEGTDADLVVAGHTVPCRISQEDGCVVYTARAGGFQAFPGRVRVVRGEEVLIELVAVERPATPPPAEK